MTSLQRERVNWMSWCTLVHPIHCRVNTLHKDLLPEVSQSGQERWRHGRPENQGCQGSMIISYKWCPHLLWPRNHLIIFQRSSVGRALAWHGQSSGLHPQHYTALMESTRLSSQHWGGKGRRIRNSRSSLTNESEASLGYMRCCLKGSGGREGERKQGRMSS